MGRACNEPTMKTREPRASIGKRSWSRVAVLLAAASLLPLGSGAVTHAAGDGAALPDPAGVWSITELDWPGASPRSPESSSNAVEFAQTLSFAESRRFNEANLRPILGTAFDDVLFGAEKDAVGEVSLSQILRLRASNPSRHGDIDE